MVDSATTAPTDRSMPPVSTTKVMPTATTRRKALSISRLRTTWPEKKPSYCTEPMLNIDTSRAAVTSSGICPRRRVSRALAFTCRPPG